MTQAGSCSRPRGPSTAKPSDSLRPDTVVTLTNGNKLLVRDTMDEVRAKIIEFKREIYVGGSQPDGR